MTSQPRDAPQFYLTSPSACPYLPGKEERKVFTHIVNEFEPSGNLKRVLKDNADLIGHALPNRPTSEQYSLFRRYVDTRHADGGMADMTVLDYSMMVEDSHVDTKLIEYRRRGIDSPPERAG